MDNVLDILRTATEGGRYDGRLYLVGGIVRDKLLEKPSDEDIDIVLEGDAGELAEFLHEKGVAEHAPVTYPRFGTAMITVGGTQVELVGARRESYDPTSRKPSTSPGTLLDDVLRRDFTINTLLENLHTGEILDLTGRGMVDLWDKLIRTPVDPASTFADDPLRMLRAIRFATRLGFRIDEETYAAIGSCASRLGIVSGERIREEFVKIIMGPDAVAGLEMLRETTLLDQFAPELSATYGVTQNIYHIHDVWTHTIKTLELIPVESGIILRLAALLHDVGKVETRTVDEIGAVHFYDHQHTGSDIARRVMHRLRFSNSQIDEVAFLISRHLRVGEYDKQWSDAAVRRLIREAGDHLEDLILLTAADKGASNPAMPRVDLDEFRAHVERAKERLAGRKIASPLDGREIIDLLGFEPGPEIGKIKAYLEHEIIEGNLLPGDKAAARDLALRKYGRVGDSR
ncbi:MAG: CCA tRNA nucleotidyltransferase [Armatimonadetes bacterium]|nr:CCA tRNA nucleotidyltransferase [Armatimonadota bacterium]